MPGQEQVIEATIQGIEPDGNGWVKVNTDQGQFTTKFPEPIAEAQAHLGQRVLIAYEMGVASTGRNGVVYPAPRYFRRVAQPGYVQPQQAQPQYQPQAQPQPVQQQPQQQPQAPENDDTRAMRIMRQTAGKLAVATMPLVPSEQRTFPNQIAVAEAWMRYFIGGPQGLGSQQAQQVITQEQAMAGVGPQDDIPF